MLDVILLVIAIILLAITLLAKLPLHHWWIRAGEFPRLQLASLAILVLALLPLSSGSLTLPTLVCGTIVLGIQLYYILPWTPLWRVQVQRMEPGQEARCLSILIANVLMTNRRDQPLAQLIERHQPDVILTLESDHWWQSRLEEALGDDWPHRVAVPLDNLYGMHVFSRLPLGEPDVKWLIQDDIPSIHTWIELPGGDHVRLHALHPRPPAPNESEESLWRDAELLLVGKEVDQANVPTLVAGDLNDVAWSRTTRLFCRVSGMLDPRQGRGMFSTFHAGYPLLRWPLDHIFVSEHFTLGGIQRLPHIGSDHFPILATLCFRPSRADEHDPPEADAQERQEARETIAEAHSRDQQT